MNDTALQDTPQAPSRRALGASLLHDSALKHTTGEARFLDDIPEPHGLLHAAFALSTVAHGRLAPLDPAPARAVPGVVAVLLPADIPGRNDISGAGTGEVLLADGLVECAGQPLAIVVGETRDAALAGAAALTPEIAPLPPVLTIEDAITQESWVQPPQVITRGDPAAALAAAPRCLSGEFRVGGQEHFYMESQIAMAVPGEDGELTVHSSTQITADVQHITARVLGCDDKSVTVTTRRMGGAFGGKTSDSVPVAAAAALAARRTGRPVKMRLSRKLDITTTGKRHAWLYRWSAGFDTSGRLLALDATMVADAGRSRGLTGDVVHKAILHALNCYDVPAVCVRALACKTNTVSNVACRGFGATEGMLLMEDVVHRVAKALGRSPEEVRERNFAGGENDAETPYGQALEGDLIRRVWAEARRDSDWDARRLEIAAFNAQHPYLRRGLGSMVFAFGTSLPAAFQNQSGALVHVNTDGSIRLNHGGTEMGQGLFIKMAQVVAEVLGVDPDRIAITASSTAEVPNTTPSAVAPDVNGWAAHDAALAIRGRMAQIAAGEWGLTPGEIVFADGRVTAGSDHVMDFGELASLAFRKGVSLSAAGFYRTPDLYWDEATMRGHPYFYHSYGGAVAEVVVDTLTGETRCLSAQLVQECGRSINPALNLGQVEGAFVQGMGWLTCEELWWDAKGILHTLGPSTYKIPGSRDVPPVLHVRLLETPARVETIFRSKTVGEAPLALGTAVWNALKDAIGTDRLDAPATPERVLMATRGG